MNQLMLAFPPEPCSHKHAYLTHAYVPAGVSCSICGELLMQNYIPPDQPERIGYVSADWAWHYRDGKPWTTSSGIEIQEAA